MNDKWQNNSSLSDTRCEQHGQPGCEVGTARKVNSPGWQQPECETGGGGKAVLCVCMCVLCGERKREAWTGKVKRNLMNSHSHLLPTIYVLTRFLYHYTASEFVVSRCCI